MHDGTKHNLARDIMLYDYARYKFTVLTHSVYGPVYNTLCRQKTAITLYRMKEGA